MNQLGVWKHLRVLSNLPALFKSFKTHKQEIAGYDLTWLNLMREELVPKAMKYGAKEWEVKNVSSRSAYG